MDGQEAQLTRIARQRARQVEAADVEHIAHRHLRLCAALDRRERVDPAQPRLDPCEVALERDEVDLVEQQPVGESHLADGFVDRPLLLREVVRQAHRAQITPPPTQPLVQM